MKWNTLANKESLNKTIAALKEVNIDAIVVNSGEDAKKKVLELLPKNAEVMVARSTTLDMIGISQVIDESGDYDSVRNKLNKLNPKTQSQERQKLGAAPEWVLGSIHAVTVEGKVLIASATGSQLSAYVFGSPHVIWVVGTQKIVKNLDDGMKRINEYILPLESKRVNKQFNITTGSFVGKLLILNKETVPQRIRIIFVKEVLGF